MIRCSLHNHTTWCDGAHTPEEMVLEALRLGSGTVGIAEHSPFPKEPEAGIEPGRLGDYYRELCLLKARYAGQIEVAVGLEQDVFSPAPDCSFNYLIGSVHYIEKDGKLRAVDVSREDLEQTVREAFGGDPLAFAEHYYRTAAKVPALTGCDIIGHFDLVTKFNRGMRLFDTDATRYRRAVMEALEELQPRGQLFEINSGAVAKGYRGEPYPELWILRVLRQQGAQIVLSSDAHRKEHILFGFEQMTALAREAGFREAVIWHDGGWQTAPLER